MELTSLNTDDLDIIAEQLLENHAEANIFAFYGKMGAGKTTFIKSICKKLNVTDEVVSPSFCILNEYKSKNNTLIYHFDFYRIKNILEFFDLGFEEYFHKGSYCFIEWPEKIESFIPQRYVAVIIEEKKGKRIIKF